MILLVHPNIWGKNGNKLIKLFWQTVINVPLLTLIYKINVYLSPKEHPSLTQCTILITLKYVFKMTCMSGLCVQLSLIPEADWWQMKNYCIMPQHSRLSRFII